MRTLLVSPRALAVALLATTCQLGALAACGSDEAPTEPSPEAAPPATATATATATGDAARPIDAARDGAATDPCGPNGESHDDHCDCDPGYVEVGGRCVPRDAGNDDAGSRDGASDASLECSGHGHLHGGVCHCDIGYTIGTTPTTCVALDGGADASLPTLSYTITRVAFDPTLASYGRAINDSRVIVGNGNAPAVTGLRAFHFSTAPAPAGTMTNLGVVPGSNNFSRAYAVNAAGVVVGESDNNIPKAFRWEAGDLTDIGTLGGTSAVATGINASGTIVGASSNGSASRAFKWTLGTMVDLGSIDGKTTTAARATAINGDGDVAGYSRNEANVIRATLWRANGAIVNLGYLAPNRTSWAHAVNATDTVVGSAVVGSLSTGTEIYHPFVWHDGTMRDLGVLGSFTHAEAMGVNDAGWVVGYSGTLYNAQTLGSAAAVLWVDGRIVDLNTVLPAGSGWTLLSAMGINAQGDIVGYGRKDGVVSAFLLTRNL